MSIFCDFCKVKVNYYFIQICKNIVNVHVTKWKLFCRLSLYSPEEGFNSYLRGPDSRDPEERGDSSSPSVCSSSANDCKLPTKTFFSFFLMHNIHFAGCIHHNIP